MAAAAATKPQDTGSRWSINRRLLPIKVHYFFFFGAMGGSVPFMPVLAKGLGINATAVGLIYTVLPFCVFFSKPLFGFVTDYLRNLKCVVLLLVCVTSAGYTAVLFIPPIPSSLEARTAEIQHLNSTHIFLTVSRQVYDVECLRNFTLETPWNATIHYVPCESNSTKAIIGKISIEHIEDSSNSSEFLLQDLLLLKFTPDANLTLECVANNSITFESNDSCSVKKVEKSVYTSYQFWMFTLLAVIAGTGSATVFCLSDAACYEVLEDKPELYGRQRLWATISWGAVTFLAGFFNDLATAETGVTNYAPGFFLMLGMVAVDLILLLKIKLTKANFSLNICQDVGKIFSSCETVAFATAVYIIGALTGLIWNYQFWFLQDLGANQTLLGLCVAVQCLVAEVPFFFFAGWLIDKFGYFYCVTGSFVAFGFRLCLYYILENPWMVLPIEILHGLTFAVFYASMTGYASTYAPPGTEATMMGILGGLFEGLGVATGSLLGGVGFDKLGGARTFLMAGAGSFLCAPAFLLVHFLIRKLRPEAERGR